MRTLLREVAARWNGRHSRLVSLSGWDEAETFADVGELVARWLTGEIPAQPGYDGGPDEETAELIPTLARVNRAGYVTNSSQPGYDGPSFDGGRAQQRAAVEGLAVDYGNVARLRMAAEAAGLLVVVRTPPRWRSKFDSCIPVSRWARDGEWRIHTRFGVNLSRREVVWLYDHIEAAHTAMARAWQVTIVDPEWGRNDRLWLVLDAFAATRTPRPRTR